MSLEFVRIWGRRSSQPCPQLARFTGILIFCFLFGPRTRDPGLCPDLAGGRKGVEATAATQ